MLIPSSCLKLLCDVMAHPGLAAICSSVLANRKTAEAFLCAVRIDEYFQYFFLKKYKVGSRRYMIWFLDRLIPKASFTDILI